MVNRAQYGVALLLVAVAFVLVPAGVASAEDPPGCTGSGLNVSFDPSSGLSIVHRNGDHLDIAVRVSNNSGAACSVDGATVAVHLPAPDGTATGPVITLVSGASFPGGMAQTTLSTTAPYDVGFNPGIFHGPISASYSGTGHYPGGDALAAGSSGTTVVVSKPHITLTVSPSAPSGAAPFPVTYTYTATNDSPIDPDAGQPRPGLLAPNSDMAILADDTCSPLTFTGGDTHVSSPPILDQGESWTFTCSHLFNDPGTFTNHASILGISTRDGRDWPVTVAQSTVTSLGPDLTVTKTHSGDFLSGDAGRTYTITATNSGNQPTSGVATLHDALPANLTLTGISGEGWTCEAATATCTRADSLAGGASYPPVTVTVSVAPHLPGTQVTNVATISGGGEITTTNDSASDPTSIVPVNTIGLGKLKKNRKKGTAMLSVTVQAPGSLVLSGKGVKRITKIVPAAGTIGLPVKTTGAAKRKLGKSGKAKVKAQITFTPTGGVSKTEFEKVKLLKKRRPR